MLIDVQAPKRRCASAAVVCVLWPLQLQTEDCSDSVSSAAALVSPTGMLVDLWHILAGWQALRLPLLLINLLMRDGRESLCKW
jgi:hypothetical protein